MLEWVQRRETLETSVCPSGIQSGDEDMAALFFSPPFLASSLQVEFLARVRLEVHYLEIPSVSETQLLVLTPFDDV